MINIIYKMIIYEIDNIDACKLAGSQYIFIGGYQQ